MARTIYGAELFKSPNLGENYDSSFIGTNSEVITRGAPLSLVGGFVIVNSGTMSTVGVATATATMSATNQTVARVKPSFIPIDQEYDFLMGTNADISATNVGVYYQLTGTSTTIQVDITYGATTGSSRLVVCSKADPLNEGGTGSGSGARQGLFKFVRVSNLKSDGPAAV